MKKSLKNFGMGLVYILILPIIVVATLLMGLYGVFCNIYYFFKGVWRFFTGETFFEPLPEDIELKHLLKYNEKSAREAKVDEPTPNVKNESVTNTSTTYIQNNYYTTDKKEEPINQQPHFTELNNYEGFRDNSPRSSIEQQKGPVFIETNLSDDNDDEIREFVDVEPLPRFDINNIKTNDDIRKALDEDPFFISIDDDYEGGDR